MFFVQKPGSGVGGHFLLLFSALSIAALIGLLVNMRIAERKLSRLLKN